LNESICGFCCQFLVFYILEKTASRDTTLTSHQSGDDLPHPCKPASPSSHRSNRSTWCFPLIHFRSVRVRQNTDRTCGFTCTACAEDSGVPNTCQHCIGETESGTSVPLIGLIIVLGATIGLTVTLCVRHSATVRLGVECREGERLRFKANPTKTQRT
jgi:hypothetical protein